jgi:pimeloyl-ACP methyl ester carboxylesterase
VWPGVWPGGSIWMHTGAVGTGGVVRVGLVAATAVGLGALGGRYRRDQHRARARLAGTARQVIATRFGTVEYAVRAEGEPLLVSHGIFHGCDGGLLAVRDVVAGRRIIVPSRFGYLGSELPADATVADQAAAFVEVLDHLELDTVDVIGISAGTGAAVELALGHPGRVGHLVISSGNWPGSPTTVAPPAWAKVFYNDPAMWAIKICGGPLLGGLMGVPKGFPRNADDRQAIDEMVDSIFPVEGRVEGALFDAYVSNPAISTCHLESLAVPTLVIHAIDDPLASFEAAERAATRIPGALLVALDSGGHLGLGQNDRVRREIAAFLG